MMEPELARRAGTDRGIVRARRFETMRRTLSIAILAGTVMMAAPGLAPEAHASRGGFFFGAGFHIGGFPFVIGYAEPGYSHHHGYYYRTPRHIAYRGHSCSSACYRDAGYYYHHESCPVTHRYFRSYEVDHHWVLSRYAPHYDRYGGYDRYDRYDDRYSRYDDRYDRYDRRRGRDDDRHYRRGRGRDRYGDDYYDKGSRRHGRNRHDGYRRDRGHRRHDHRSHRGRPCPYDH
jgi:hypothetical protein